MSHFDETSGHISCSTEWGRWWQTMEEVYVEVDVPMGTKSKQVKCVIKPKSLTVAVNGKTLIEGEVTNTVKASDSVWTLEDNKLLRVCLLKVHTTADHCWGSLLKGQYEADPHTLDEMQKKLTLQRYQFENPGFDFSNADISGNYQRGGPQLPNR